ncbi:hypothetical membrane protein [Bacteroides ovatus V975]|nr:hypothetical membrane protein [Bacteroides ovatus V975]
MGLDTYIRFFSFISELGITSCFDLGIWAVP